MGKKVLVLANDETTILHFRLEIIRAFIGEGFSVTVCYPLGDNTETVRATGCDVVDLKVSRHGKSIIKDLALLKNCVDLINTYKPDVVLTYTVKPNIYGSFACQLKHVPYINNITGLGSILQKESALSKLILGLQKIAYRKSSCVFFQNSENCERLKSLGVINDKTAVQILPGSGVNLDAMKYEPFPTDDGITRFIIVSRIREDKGYNEFVDAAESIKRDFPNTEFHAVGWYEEGNLKKRVDELNAAGTVIYHGQKTQEEVHELVKQCNCLVHPSYHEGMSNVLMEAASTGRPVIASDIPGCRETFEEGVSGFGCQVKSSESLIAAIKMFLQLNYETQVRMGLRGREKMETEFDRRFVALRYINQIKKI